MLLVVFIVSGDNGGASILERKIMFFYSFIKVVEILAKKNASFARSEAF